VIVFEDEVLASLFLNPEEGEFISMTRVKSPVEDPIQSPKAGNTG
jgi:hypothetical protein